MRMIMGLDRPTSDTVTVYGTPYRQSPCRAGRPGPHRRTQSAHRDLAAGHPLAWLAAHREAVRNHVLDA
jgi:hypothetical protein